MNARLYLRSYPCSTLSPFPSCFTGCRGLSQRALPQSPASESLSQALLPENLTCTYIHTHAHIHTCICTYNIFILQITKLRLLKLKKKRKKILGQVHVKCINVKTTTRNLLSGMQILPLFQTRLAVAYYSPSLIHEFFLELIIYGGTCNFLLLILQGLF